MVLSEEQYTILAGINEKGYYKLEYYGYTEEIRLPDTRLKKLERLGLINKRLLKKSRNSCTWCVWLTELGKKELSDYATSEIVRLYLNKDFGRGLIFIHALSRELLPEFLVHEFPIVRRQAQSAMEKLIAQEYQQSGNMDRANV